MAHCTICGNPLDVPGNRETEDCGGDCVACMADIVGDPDSKVWMEVLRNDGRYSIGPFSRVFFWHTLRDGLQTYTFRNPTHRRETKGTLVYMLTTFIHHDDHLAYVNTKEIT